MRAHEIVQIWDSVVDEFLKGEHYLPSPLDRWFSSYAGKGRGQVTLDACPEPYIGPVLDAKPRAVTLGLNPGHAHLDLQSVTGLFANEIRELGSYHAWAATWPYLGETWLRTRGRKNMFHNSRLNFLRRWFNDPTLSSDSMLAVELYPWHSTGVTGPMRPDPGIIREFVWEPIADLGNPIVFAFGKEWLRLIDVMGLHVEGRFGQGGIDFGSAVPSRAVIVARTPDGGVIVAEKHSGSAGPPGIEETRRLRDAVSPWA